MRTINVPSAADYDTAVRRYASRGLCVTAQGDTWTTLQRPAKPARSMWRAVKLTCLTLGLYPFWVLLWWGFFAWWVRPIMAASRPDRVTVRMDATTKGMTP